MVLLLSYLLLALVVSFFCSILEAVLLSITPSYIEARLGDGKKWAQYMLDFKKDIDRPLASILSLNTISHTVGAAGVGAQAGLVFENISVGVISAVLTLLILIFSELIPKTIGAVYWKQLAFFTTNSLRFLNIIMYPLVLLSRLITIIFPTKNEPSVDRSEVIALAEIGKREGVFSQTEARILQNLIRLRSVSVRDIMTPRMVMVAAPENMTVQEFSEDDRYYRVSRVPLFKDSKDNIHYFVHKHDVMNQLSNENQDMKLSELARRNCRCAG
ncbi:MAG: CNNM domain-containing protein [Owenweeksia sp.]|nr:CNNM domain-containing protein [Owenweeksia sp.]